MSHANLSQQFCLMLHLFSVSYCTRRWPQDAGGISSANLLNSSILSSLSWEKDTIKFQLCMWFIMESCHLAVRMTILPTFCLRNITTILLNFYYSLVGRQIHARRPLVILRLPQRLRSHRHVLLLYACRNRTTNAALSLVEEILDTSADGAIRCRDGSRIPASLLQSMQLSNFIRLVDRNACMYVLLLVQEFLQWSIPKGEW